jgi:hypothetical protein
MIALGRVVARGIFVVGCAGVCPRIVSAQSVPLSVSVDAGGEIERYLRVLQLLGMAPEGQWTIRPFGPIERKTQTLAASHVWASLPDSLRPSPNKWSVVAPRVDVVENTSFPYGFNDGALWAGRGATVSASSGVAGDYSRFSGQLAPLAFIAENAPFALGPGSSFADWDHPSTIDFPQRFGGRSYARVDLGESWLRFDSHLLAVGVSNQAQVWGPGIEEPIILGNNAGGFPHAFAGTGAPVPVGIGQLHGKIFWGVLDQSAYVVDDSATTPRHFGTGLVGSFQFRHPRGLEIGGARFFHTPWNHGTLGDVPWTRTFEAFLKDRLPSSVSNPNGDNPDNQLASAFFRWVFAPTGFEVYGEFGREDHSGDIRDLAAEPDHDSAYLLGLQRAWPSKQERSISVFRAEVLNSRLSHLSGQTPWYVHGFIRQGHTERGQLLAAPGGYGGGGASFAYDRYSENGRSTIRIDRLLLGEERATSTLPIASDADVSYALRVERARFTRAGEVAVSAGVVREFNRYFGRDAWNLNLTSTVAAFRLGTGR